MRETTRKRLLELRRPKLTLALAPSKPALSLVKQALRLFKGRGIAREVYRRNALKWIAAKLALGDRHILNKEVKATWGLPGKLVGQVFAPRRYGERA